MDKELAQIKQRAHEIYLERGADHGRDLDDWLRAEREITGVVDTLPSPEARKERASAAKSKTAGASKSRKRNKTAK